MQNPRLRAIQRKATLSWIRRNMDHKVFINFRSNMRRKYGLSLEQLLQMGDQQGWRCAVCRVPFKEAPVRKQQGFAGYFFQVDHDHARSTVRGLLCFNCNGMLGKAHDNPEILLRAVSYLAGKPNRGRILAGHGRGRSLPR